MPGNGGGAPGRPGAPAAPGIGNGGKPPGGGEKGRPPGGMGGMPLGPGAPGKGGMGGRPRPAAPGGAAVWLAEGSREEGRALVENVRARPGGNWPGGAPGMPGKGGGAAPVSSSVSSTSSLSLGRTGRERRATREGWERRRRTEATGAGLVLREHGVCVGLALGGVGRGDGVDDRLGLFVADFWELVSRCVSGETILGGGEGSPRW